MEYPDGSNGGEADRDVVMSKDCKNTHVINELEIPIVVMGAENMVVAASPDGILLADKVQSSYIKKICRKIVICARCLRSGRGGGIHGA